MHLFCLLNSVGNGSAGRPGIVLHEQQFRRLTSVSDAQMSAGNYRTDPLNVAVFKASAAGGGTSFEKKTSEFEPPSVIYKDADKARSSSYRAAIDRGCERQTEQDFESEVNKDSNDGVSVVLRESVHSADVTQSCFEYNDASLMRAAEWVNRSPVPHPRFIKSKSLHSSSSASRLDEVSGDVSTSAVPSDAGSGCMQDSVSAPASVLPPRQSSPLNITAPAASQPHLIERSNSDQSSANSGSPSIYQKSPKLQGLILRVDAGGLNSSSSTSSTCDQPKVVISTQHPTHGVFTEKQLRSISPLPDQSAARTDSQPEVQQTSSSTTGIPAGSPQPPTSLMNKLKQSASSSQVFSYESKVRIYVKSWAMVFELMC